MISHLEMSDAGRARDPVYKYKCGASDNLSKTPQEAEVEHQTAQLLHTASAVGSLC